jgi:transcriptional regulator with XRE-family HTH domain
MDTITERKPTVKSVKEPTERGEAARQFAERLRNTRERQKLTQSELGRRSGLSPAAISQLEAGLREPTFSTIVSLASALGTTPNDLMGLEEGSPDPSIAGLFRNLKKMSPDDFEKVKSYAQFLLHQQDEE